MVPVMTLNSVDFLSFFQFMAQYYQLKLSGIAGPSDSPLSIASTIADLLASVVRIYFIFFCGWMAFTTTSVCEGHPQQKLQATRTT